MSDANRIVIVYTTLPDPETAERIGRDLVERGLTACANILPGMVSLYSWEGALERSSEAVLLLKTLADRAVEVREAVAALHPYDCPCILVWPVDAAHPPYLDWVRAQSRGA